MEIPSIALKTQNGCGLKKQSWGSPGARGPPDIVFVGLQRRKFELKGYPQDDSDGC